MGVKSLWTLLEPAGRPVLLETVEGKSMAIDSSIWIYQFQATMRDKEGRGLVNAHVLGFLRRICKLLFYGIKPVFVFDGGAPPLKRMTIAERKRKKSGAAESHERIAQKLLAAQMRREALIHAHSSSSRDVNKPPQGPVTVDKDTVYFEDLDVSAPRTPTKKKSDTKESLSSPAKKSRWQDYDPYRLPDVDMDAAIAKATRPTAPDPRLATEDELRLFIEMLRPEDLDVNSPAFRELPTEVQYEIVGDLRLKSRQTSHKRLQAMLRTSRTALDFSRAQIQNLKQRNALTQQLLETTDSIGKANVTIPIRIASERNKEYVLVKNEDEVGGWVLGIRDEGTQDKPIVLDNAEEHVKSDQESDDDMDMEEVVIPQTATPDPDLGEYRRGLAIAGVEKRQAAAAAKGRSKLPSPAKTKKKPLFIPETDEVDADIEYDSAGEWEDVEDAELAAAMQASVEEQETNELRRAIEESRKANAKGQSSANAADSDDDLYVEFTPSRLDTALRFAYNTQDTKVSPPIGIRRHPVRAPSPSPRMKGQTVLDVDDEDEDEDMEEIEVPSQSTISSQSQPETEKNVEVIPQAPLRPEAPASDMPLPSKPKSEVKESASQEPTSVRQDKVEPVSSRPRNTTRQEHLEALEGTHEITKATLANGALANHTSSLEESQGSARATRPSSPDNEQMLPVASTDASNPIHPIACHNEDQRSGENAELPASDTRGQQSAEQIESEPSSDDEVWSRPGFPENSQEHQFKADQNEEGWDAAEEMNVYEETGEFARFAAQVRGRDLDTVRAEIDDEIQQLRQQRKAALRDSDDVNQAMVAQIMTMLRLFGIPYITAPMEAEAQCAMLVELGLVDGVITDDSDVFLFGAKRVFKNMFNQSKTVECFLLIDLARELGLDRGTLIRLAYLLGSDYVLGLPGVGPVVAMELLREFPGDDGLHKFKDWWTKVQSGRDKESDNPSAFRKRFKKRFKDLYLPSDWPNPAVRDAYYHPTVDMSEELFKWGLPDLDGLRSFFHDELGWNAGKVDELLLPIIHKMNRRQQDAAANRQGTLNTFFSISEGAGPAEPRRHEAYASRRLQALVSAHRKAQKQRSESSQAEESEEEETQPARKKRKKASPAGGENGAGSSTASRRGKGKNGTAARNRRGRGGKMRTEGHDEGSAASTDSKGKRTRNTRSKAKSKSKKGAESDSDSSEEFVGKADSAPVREMELRKRVRPRPAYRKANNIDDGGADVGNVVADDSGSSESEYQE